MRDGSQQRSPSSDPCKQYGYDSRECRKSLNLPPKKNPLASIFASYGVMAASYLSHYLNASSLGYKLLADGTHVGLSGASGQFGLYGTYYKTGTVTTSVMKDVGGISKSGLITSAVFAVGQNLVDYSIGEHAGEGFGQEFAVSTVVDTLLAVAIAGGAAAAAVLLPVAAPLAIVGLTIGIAFGATMLTDAVDFDGKVESGINTFIDNLQGE
ncbi:MAG: hypothetical protein HFACDABA_02347 [Anaerolineales bacterium]|nr:hypothetical protein [Anaerolineales bacterium]